MLSDADIQKLQSKYRVKTKSQKDSYRDFLETVKSLGEALSINGMKPLSRMGVSFTRRQRWMIYCLSDHGFFGTIKKWLLQKIILKTFRESR